MKTIICQPKALIAQFVSKANNENHWDWENFSALGLMENNQLIAGVLYNHYNPPNICMHVGAIGKSWLNRDFLFAAFDYPFNQLGCGRVTALVPKKNKAARKFDEHLGFKLEGVMRQALADDDMMVYGMLRSECKYIRPEFQAKMNRRIAHEKHAA